MRPFCSAAGDVEIRGGTLALSNELSGAHSLTLSGGTLVLSGGNSCPAQVRW